MIGLLFLILEVIILNNFSQTVKFKTIMTLSSQNLNIIAAMINKKFYLIFHFFGVNRLLSSHNYTN